MTDINETHDPNLRSWVESANDPNTDFPIQNLPICLFHRLERCVANPRLGVIIGDQILDVFECAEQKLLEPLIAGYPNDMILENSSLGRNSVLLGFGMERFWTPLRRQLVDLLRAENTKIANDEDLVRRLIQPVAYTEFFLPAEIGDYTDFYASIYHATNIGKMFRPDQPLMPNYKWVPIGYHGRASSVEIGFKHEVKMFDKSEIYRPSGQLMVDGANAPVFGSSQALDFELEVGCFISYGNQPGEPINISDAEKHIFGLCLVNDWSARDIQRWEYQPLGPFLSKSFATSISPWIVTTEALAPFRVPAFKREADDPQPLPYLDSPQNRERGGFDIKIEVLISTEQMRQKNLTPHRLSASNTKDLYWTFAQMLTHHSSNGCNLNSGDLLASGTVSGSTKGSQGSLIELTERGAQPITLPTGEIRRFLEDGDEVILRGYCEREGFRRIGFGECRGQIVGQASVQPT